MVNTDSGTNELFTLERYTGKQFLGKAYLKVVLFICEDDYIASKQTLLSRTSIFPVTLFKCCQLADALCCYTLCFCIICLSVGRVRALCPNGKQIELQFGDGDSYPPWSHGIRRGAIASKFAVLPPQIKIRCSLFYDGGWEFLFSLLLFATDVLFPQ